MMRLTWRDAVATLMTGGAVALYLAYRAGADVPLVTGTRPAAGAVLVLGLAACAVGGGGQSDDEDRPRAMRWIGAFSVVPILAALVAIVARNEVALTVLVWSTAAIWLATTVRHAVSGRGGITDQDLHRVIDLEQRTGRQV